MARRRHARSSRAVLALFVLAFWGSMAVAGELTGKGEWQSFSSELIRGTWSATLTRVDDRVEGRIEIRGSNVFGGGQVSGEMRPTQVVLGVMAAGSKQALFSGKLTGTTVEGEWTADAIGDSGMWKGTLE